VEEDGTHFLFLAQKASKNLKYPVYSGQSFMENSVVIKLNLHINGKTVKQEIEFKPYQSVVLKINPGGNIENVDITFNPKDPVVRPKEKQRMHF
jgi:hypothetical protein